MKKLLSIFLIILVCSGFTACNGVKKVAQHNTEYPLTTVSVTYDMHGNIITKCEHNSISGDYIFYEYIYKYTNGMYVCTSQEMTVINSEGAQLDE